MNRLLKRLPVELIAVSLAVCAFAPLGSGILAEDNAPSNLPGLLSEGSLTPPLPSEFMHLKFSPDGTYILAQDNSRIFVLTRQPLAVHFRISSPNAEPAQFSPDSSEVVFSTGGSLPSVERWSVARGEKTFGKALILVGTCLEGRLSPDGKTFACFSEHEDPNGHFAFGGCRRSFVSHQLECLDSTPLNFRALTTRERALDIDFELIDVSSGDILVQKKNFIPWDVDTSGFLLEAKQVENFGHGSMTSIIPASFSPGGRYFAAAFRKHGIAVDMESRKIIPLGGDLGRMLGAGFAFTSGDQVLAENQADPSKSELLDFPSGAVNRAVPLSDQQIEGVTGGRYAILRPIRVAPVGVLDTQTSEMVAALPEPTGLDVWKGHMVAQSSDGQITLTNLENSKVEAKLGLPTGPLGDVEVASISEDLHWLAVSTAARGALWDLSNPRRRDVVRSFQGAFFEGGSALYIDLPGVGDQPRSIGRMDLATLRTTATHSLDGATPETKQYGRYLVSVGGADKRGVKPSFTVRNVRDGRALWTRTFAQEAPQDFEISPDQDRLVFLWMAEQKPAMEEIKKDKSLKATYGKISGHSEPMLLEVVDAQTGKDVGNVLVDTTSLASVVEYAQNIPVRVAGDWLYVMLGGETRVYSIANGEFQTTAVGQFLAASAPAGLYAVRAKDSSLEVLSLQHLENHTRLDLASEPVFVQFSDDGKRLFALTRDQKFHIFDAEVLVQPARGKAAE